MSLLSCLLLENRVRLVAPVLIGCCIFGLSSLAISTVDAEQPTTTISQNTSPETELAVGDEFAAGVAFAQQRTVKIYGGGIGRTPGYASGIIVSADGEIVTASGAFLAADSLRVTLPSGQTFPAEVVRRSLPLQLVLLKVDTSTPEYFDLNSSADVDTGDWILALSNAFKVAEGAEPLSVNVGVLSLRTKLTARRGFVDFPYEDEVFLIDAITSNPGAAGGAVVSVEGKLVGMIGKVIESKNTNTRLNYAVPADLIAGFVAGQENTPEAMPPVASSAKGELGIRLFTLGGRKGPAYIDRVLPGSPAADAGVKTDDLVVAINGEVVRDSGDFQRAINAITEGSEVTIDLKRRNEVLQIRVIAAGTR